MKVRRFIKIFIISLSAIIILGAAAGLTLQYLFGGKVKELFVREINKQLATEVKVDNIQLSLFQDFPYASVRFTGVQMKEATKNKSGNNLLKAGVISLKFNLPDLLRSRFSVRFISVTDAVVNIHIFPDGSDNFHIFKPSAGKQSEQFELNIKRFSFKEVKFSYLDDEARQQAKLDIHRIMLKGDFKNEVFRMNAGGKLLVDKFSSGDIVYIARREIGLNAGVDIDTRTGLYAVNSGEIIMEKLHLSLNGWIYDHSDRKVMDVTVSALQTPAREVFLLIPEKYRKQADNYQFAGSGDFSVVMKGIYGNGRIPSLTMKISMNDGSIIQRKTAVGLENVSFSGVYFSPQDGSTMQLNLDNLKATLSNGSVTGNISMQGFKSPVIKATLAGIFNLADLKNFLDLDTITRLSGMMNIAGVFSGSVADINNPVTSDFRNSRFSGTCTLNGVSLGLKGYNLPVTALTGSFAFNNNDLNVNTLTGRFGSSDFSVKGSVGNLLSRIFVNNEKLIVKGSFLAEKVDGDELSTSSGGKGEYNFGIPGDIEISGMKMDIRNFHFRKFDAKNLSATISMHNSVFTASDILLQSMQGTVTGEATINASNPAHSYLTCEVDVNKVNINRLFAEFGNFGNTDLVAENLDGKVTGNVLFSGMMYPDLTIDLPSIKAHAELMVENGRLVNYAPMMGLSSFLRVEDLKDIRFETLTNQIDIANEIIYIPVMDINSSALDLTLMGTHTFDNELNYHFSIALADLLASKFRRHNPGYNKQDEFGPVASDGRRTMVFVSMTGTVDEPVFKYDKKAVREKITTEMQGQRTELKQALNREFQWISGDSTKRAKILKEKEIQKKQEDGKFVIEWDDDDRKGE